MYVGFVLLVNVFALCSQSYKDTGKYIHRAQKTICYTTNDISPVQIVFSYYSKVIMYLDNRFLYSSRSSSLIKASDAST